jgi:hypothetical protein
VQLGGLSHCLAKNFAFAEKSNNLPDWNTGTATASSATLCQWNLQGYFLHCIELNEMNAESA